MAVPKIETIKTVLQIRPLATGMHKVTRHLHVNIYKRSCLVFFIYQQAFVQFIFSTVYRTYQKSYSFPHSRSTKLEREEREI